MVAQPLRLPHRVLARPGRRAAGLAQPLPQREHVVADARHADAAAGQPRAYSTPRLSIQIRALRRCWPSLSTGTRPPHCAADADRRDVLGGHQAARGQPPGRGDDGPPPVVRVLLGPAARQQHGQRSSPPHGPRISPRAVASATFTPPVPRSTPITYGAVCWPGRLHCADRHGATPRPRRPGGPCRARAGARRARCRAAPPPPSPAAPRSGLPTTPGPRARAPRRRGCPPAAGAGGGARPGGPDVDLRPLKRHRQAGQQHEALDGQGHPEHSGRVHQREQGEDDGRGRGRRGSMPRRPVAGGDDHRAAPRRRRCPPRWSRR